MTEIDAFEDMLREMKFKIVPQYVVECTFSTKLLFISDFTSHHMSIYLFLLCLCVLIGFSWYLRFHFLKTHKSDRITFILPPAVNNDAAERREVQQWRQRNKPITGSGSCPALAVGAERHK